MTEFDKGRWYVFEVVTTAHAEKQMYFLDGDGTVYSRWSNCYMSVDEAITEFCDMLFWKG